MTVHIVPDTDPFPSGPALKAHQAVRGERQSTYGHPLDNHARIVRLWNARLHEKLHTALTEEDVTALMRLVKEARLMESPGHYDSFVDIAGYADVEHEIHAERLRRAVTSD